jgi:hypothetical protein
LSTTWEEKGAEFGPRQVPLPTEVITLAVRWYLRFGCPQSGRFIYAARRGESASTMRERTASRLAWSVGAISIALMIGALVLMFIDRHAALPD